LKTSGRFVNLKRTKILKPKLPFAESAARRGWGVYRFKADLKFHHREHWERREKQ